MTFEQWMEAFDKALIKKIGVPSECLPDWYFWDAWNDGWDVDEAVTEFLIEVQDY